MKTIILGARGSQLALAQAELAKQKNELVHSEDSSNGSHTSQGTAIARKNAFGSKELAPKTRPVRIRRESRSADRLRSSL